MSFVRNSLKYLVICQYLHKIIYILHVLHDESCIQHIQDLFQSWLVTADYALNSVAEATITI
jgi:hypothetical protein